MERKTITRLTELKKCLGLLSPCPKRVFVGFDGFVDTILRAVRQRHPYTCDYFKTIRDFASRIDSAAGRSGQIELVTKCVKLGGNAPILSNTLGRLGIRSYCAGSLGYPERHPVFSEMNEKCTVMSLCNPGDSRAVEFDDGKIILSELSAFTEYDWRRITKTHGLSNIQDAVCDSAIVAFVDWANLPFASEIWEGILEDVVKPSQRRDFQFFFDLCDPSRKTTEQIDEVLDLISCFSYHGKVTVGMNENETLKIWCAIHGIDSANAARHELPSVREAGQSLFKTMNIDCLLVHPVDRTIVFQKHETIELNGRVVTEPKVLTGGGDNLNAGFLLGILHGFNIRQCMLLGMAASGAYIQNGIGPDVKAIIEYICVWIDDLKKAELAEYR